MAKTKTYPKLSFEKMPLYDLQQEIADSLARYKVVALGRQSGKSFFARWMALKKAANEGKRVWWVAPTISAAKQHWDELLRLLEDAQFPTKNTSRTDKQIDFLSGGFLRIRSADDPDNLRGATLDFLIMDEAAFMPSRVWYEILWPTLTASRGEALFLTTPNGRNWFHKLYTLGLDISQDLWRSWNAPSWASPYQDKQALKEIKKVTPGHIYRQEYGAEFLSDAGGVFHGVDEVLTVKAEAEPRPEAEYVAGIDWGDVNDATCITIVDKVRIRQVYGLRLIGLSQKETIERIVGVLAHWRPKVTYVEAVGIGVPLLKQLKERINAQDVLGEANIIESRSDITKIIAIYTSNSTKRELVEKLAVLIEYKHIRLLRDTDDYGAVQVNEMSTFERHRTPSGTEITYRGAGKAHDDTVMALVMAAKGLPYARPVNIKDRIAIEKNKQLRKDSQTITNPFRRSRVRYATRGARHNARRY